MFLDVMGLERIYTDVVDLLLFCVDVSVFVCLIDFLLLLLLLFVCYCFCFCCLFTCCSCFLFLFISILANLEVNGKAATRKEDKSINGITISGKLFCR